MSASQINRLPLILLGAGGHAKVLLSLARAVGLELKGVCDQELAQQRIERWRALPVLGTDSVLDSFDIAQVGLINGVGQLVGGSVRRALYLRMRQRGFRFPALVHPTAWVDPSASLGDGVQVMAGAVIQADCRIGENSIVNTGATIDHDCVIGAHVHVAPGCSLCGGVHVRDQAFIGAGSTIIQGCRVGQGAVLSAGAVLDRDLSDNRLLERPRSAEREPSNLMRKESLT